MRSTILIGGGSGIARACCEALEGRGESVWTISRDPAEPTTAPGTRHLRSDYSEESMAACVRQLQDAGCRPARVGIFLGILHDGDLRPEKRLEDVGAQSLSRVLQVNSCLPILWLRHLFPLLAQGQECRVVVLSARVGSIGDNRLGGWYAYRASKAALNMLLKTTAIELARRAPAVKLVAFHPGTTDTPLSQPFQSNVPEGKLFTPAFVAEKLLAVLDSARPDGTLSYLDYNGDSIPW